MLHKCINEALTTQRRRGNKILNGKRAKIVLRLLNLSLVSSEKSTANISKILQLTTKQSTADQHVIPLD